MRNERPEVTRQLLDIAQGHPFVTPIATPVYDATYGMGFALEFSQPDTNQLISRIEIFTGRHALRARRLNAYVELTNITEVQRDRHRFRAISTSPEETTIFECPVDGKFFLYPPGTMPLSLSPLSDPTSSTALSSPAVRQAQEPPPTLQSVVPAEPRDEAFEQAAEVFRQDEETGASAPADPTKEKVPRVTLRGRIGDKAPAFHTTPKQHQLVAEFDLRVTDENQQETTVRIVCFGTRAMQVKEKQLSVGQEIEIVGYPHVVTTRQRGKPAETSTEIYATAVRTSLEKAPGV